jgi:xanthine dehydrogenase YagS FAD-binding subunit
MAVAMLALGATVETIDGNGHARTINLADLHRLPGSTPQVETNLRPGEMITAVVLPPPLAGGLQIYRKVRDRASYAFALVSVAAVVETFNGKIRTARLAFGGLAHKPWRVPEAEEKLIGMPPGAPAFTAAADSAFAGARGYGSNDFKVALARRTLNAVLAETTQV